VKHTKKEFIIISGELSTNTPAVNEQRTRCLQSNLDDLGVNYVACFGQYKGDREKSFLVYLEHYNGYDESFFSAMAENFNQDCILYRDKYDTVEFIYSTHREKTDKKLAEITPLKASRVEAYTYFYGIDRYWGLV